MKITIHVMSSGFNVLVERPVPLRQINPQDFEKAIAAQARGQYIPPTQPLPAAFSTLSEVERYVREQTGMGGNAEYAGEPVAQVAAGASGPDVDWEVRDRRATALNHAAALAYKADGSPADVLKAAADYEQYLLVGTPVAGENQQELDK